MRLKVYSTMCDNWDEDENYRWPVDSWVSCDLNADQLRCGSIYSEIFTKVIVSWWKDGLTREHRGGFWCHRQFQCFLSRLDICWLYLWGLRKSNKHQDCMNKPNKLLCKYLNFRNYCLAIWAIKKQWRWKLQYCSSIATIFSDAASFSAVIYSLKWYLFLWVSWGE